MKNILSHWLVISLCCLLTACGAHKKSETASEVTPASTQGTEKTLVVYFSATGNTKKVAEEIAEAVQGDLYEIVPEEPYTEEDLDYNEDTSRTSREMQDDTCRPAISDTISDFDQYTRVFLGYPIWWGQAARILDTFVESQDFTGKEVIPFCTSASSDIGSSASTLQSLCGSGDWKQGKRFSASASSEEIQNWARQFQ